MVIEDAAARALLDELVVSWTNGGALGVLRELVPAVWRRNVDRYEPVRLGDDAVSLGVNRVAICATSRSAGSSVCLVYRPVT